MSRSSTGKDALNDKVDLGDQLLSALNRDSAWQFGATESYQNEAAGPYRIGLLEAVTQLDRGEIESGLRKLRELVDAQPGSLEVRLIAIQKNVEFGHEEEALDLLETTERHFDIEATEFSQIIRSEISLRRPDLGYRTSKTRRRDPFSCAQAYTSGPALVKHTSAPNEIHIYTVTFLDFAGQRVYPGGAERYIFDLSEILSTLGYSVTIFQGGNNHWQRNIGAITVKSIPWKNSIFDLSVDFSLMTDSGAINIYSPFTLAVANIHRPSIGICHGVYWDAENSTFLNPQVSRDVFSSILHLERCISVDANSINVLRASRPDLATKLKYVPNYVGEEFFTKTVTSKRKLRLLYPRRLYGARGYWLLAEIVPRLMDRYDNLDIIFVGDSDDRERAHVENLAKRYGSRVRHVVALPSEMSGYYASADISVIPTMHSEGTSLSALEALAAGNAVVATDVGGLSNIIIDDLNGLLIAPNANELFEAICKLIDNPALRGRLQTCGRETARAFSKRKWSDAWQQIFCELLGPSEREGQPQRKRPATRIIHPATGGIVWASDTNKLPLQRPHHLMRALAALGREVTFVEDRVQTSVEADYDGRLEILGSNSITYASEAVYYVYFAYQVWALGEVGYEWISRLPEDRRAQFLEGRERYAVENSLVWFDLIDEPSLHDDRIYAEAVDLFIRHAKFVTTSSRVLRERYSVIRSDIVLVENACWPSDFDAATHYDAAKVRQLIGTSDNNARRGITIGYVGAVAPWFDFDLLEALLADRPFDRFVIVGPISADVAVRVNMIERSPNVSFVGAVPYELVPGILAEIDLAILPFLKNAITHATNPVKLYEYLASGVPVVCTNLEELRAIADSVELPFARICRTSDEFVAEVARLADQPLGEEALSNALNFARANTWLARGATVEKMLNSASEGENAGGPLVIERGIIRYGRRSAGEGRPISLSRSEQRRSLVFASKLLEGDEILQWEVPVWAQVTGFFMIELSLVQTGAGCREATVSVEIDGTKIAATKLGPGVDGLNFEAVRHMQRGLASLTIELRLEKRQRLPHPAGFVLSHLQIVELPYATKDAARFSELDASDEASVS